MKDHHIFVDSRSLINHTQKNNSDFTYKMQVPLHRAFRVQLRDITVAYPRMYLYVSIEEFSAVLPVFVSKGYDACTHCPRELSKTLNNTYIPALHSIRIRLLDEYKMVFHDDLTDMFAVTMHLVITCLGSDEGPEPHQVFTDEYVVLDSRISRMISSVPGGAVDTFCCDIMQGRKIEVEHLQIRAMTLDRSLCDEAYVYLDIPAFALSLSDESRVPIAYASEVFGNYLTLETMYIIPEIHTKVFHPRRVLNEIRVQIVSPTTNMPVELSGIRWVAIMLCVRFCEVTGSLPAEPRVPFERCDVISPPAGLPFCAHFEERQYVLLDNRKRVSGSDYAFCFKLDHPIKRVVKLRLALLVMNLAVQYDSPTTLSDWDFYTDMNIQTLGINWRVPYSSWSLPEEPNVLQTHDSIHSQIMDPPVDLYKLDIEFISRLYGGLYEYHFDKDPVVLIIFEATTKRQMV